MTTPIERGRLPGAGDPKNAHMHRLRAGLRGARFNATSRAEGLNQPRNLGAGVRVRPPPNRRLAMLLPDLSPSSPRQPLNGRRIALAVVVRGAGQ